MVNKLTLCRSDAGDGGWSLHPPGSTDDAIAEGDARILASGDSEMVHGAWSRPDADDYRAAWHEAGPNSMNSIGIVIVYGGRSVGDDDRERAAIAAAACLNEAGVTVLDAAAEYERQWLEHDDEERMTGLALTWIDARNAADIALTAGWADPCGASCTIIV